LVAPGTCGDYDGDGRIGSAEDTDGADRIFGTINAALGTGTGAAAGTGINHNGRVVIVKSGRFSESIFIGRVLCTGCPGSANPGNVTLEAAPGVDAVIDAVFQGDPGGGSETRRNSTGIAVAYLPNSNSGLTRMVVLRNLTVRNFARGAEISHNTRVLIDNCRFENNLNYGILLNFGTLAVIRGTQVSGTGFRTSGATTSSPGHGISLETNAQAKIVDSVSAHNISAGVFNSGVSSNLVLFKVGLYFNGTDLLGPFTVTLEPNYSTTN
ncbi:MAG TPA: right-handed parallel beta-helix repeat-containing protein, partial [Pyrinomonadaceae bacterium]|nr:right-handed parallel beta-helix repeat-containing protein [Pyrinomonadaceae bacterium]